MHKLRVVGASIFSAAAIALLGLAAPVGATAGPAIYHPIRFAAVNGTHATWSSSNWSGYAETGTYTAVSASWTVPTVTAGASSGGGGRGCRFCRGGGTSSWYSAVWTGIDGFNDDNLIQTGTEQDYSGGTARYQAWWEILPAAETPISETVKPDDTIDASITELSTTSGSEHNWLITISDPTEKWTFSITKAYGGAGSSAEWIVEAPEVGNSIASIADYTFPATSASTGDFNSAEVATTVGGTLTGANLSYSNDAGVLVQNGAQVSTPGQPDGPRVAFNSNYGASEPSPPSS